MMNSLRPNSGMWKHLPGFWKQASKGWVHLSSLHYIWNQYLVTNQDQLKLIHNPVFDPGTPVRQHDQLCFVWTVACQVIQIQKTQLSVALGWQA